MSHARLIVALLAVVAVCGCSTTAPVLQAAEPVESIVPKALVKGAGWNPEAARLLWYTVSNAASVGAGLLVGWMKGKQGAK